MRYHLQLNFSTSCSCTNVDLHVNFKSLIDNGILVAYKNSRHQVGNPLIKRPKSQVSIGPAILQCPALAVYRYTCVSLVCVPS